MSTNTKKTTNTIQKKNKSISYKSLNIPKVPSLFGKISSAPKKDPFLNADISKKGYDYVPKVMFTIDRKGNIVLFGPLTNMEDIEKYGSSFTDYNNTYATGLPVGFANIRPCTARSIESFISNQVVVSDDDDDDPFDHESDNDDDHQEPSKKKAKKPKKEDLLVNNTQSDANDDNNDLDHIPKTPQINDDIQDSQNQ